MENELRRSGNKLWLKIIIVLLILFALSRLFAYYPSVTYNDAMEPTLNEGSSFIARKPIFGPVKRGDMIVFEIPSTHQLYVRRIIGLPGEKVVFKNHVFTANDTKFMQTIMQKENYNEAFIYKVDFIVARDYKIRGYNIKQNDNDQFSNMTKEYNVPADSYFVAADNRNNSKDSRDPDFGYVNKNDIKGTVFYIVKNNHVEKVKYPVMF